ncbi:MAG: class IIb bacteriocin, lactobin A/cerein 7B family [Chamaesiphon sp.]|nr:class IIb bacteriocin, lactobin A/cerein 7B family [Chamaesiphon sp.]
MSQNSKKNKNQLDKNIDIDKIIDLAVENAKVRKELSDAELDEINGGIINAGSFLICNKD